VWLLFPLSRRYHPYDHTVFVTYSLSFTLLLLAVANIVSGWAGSSLVFWALVLYAPFHMYRHLLETYELSRLGACWRTWFLASFALMVLAAFGTAMLLMAAV
jgi:hypothetical protein